MITIEIIDNNIQSMRYKNQELIEGLQNGNVNTKNYLDRIKMNKEYILELQISKRIIIRNMRSY